MAVEVATWNIARGLSEEHSRFTQIVEGLKGLGDIIALPEAYAEGANVSPELIADRLGQLATFASVYGYEITDTAYQDADPTRPDVAEGFEQHIVLLHGKGLYSRVKPTRLGTRNALEFLFREAPNKPEIRGVAVHLDDRSEALRRGMVDEVFRILGVNQPTLLMGDLNAMHGDSWSARLLRTAPAGFLAEHLPGARGKWLASRLIEMADGGTMNRLTGAGLRDADVLGQATYKFRGIPFGQLDHIMTAGEVVVRNFSAKNLPGSDHKAVSAKLHTRILY